MKRYWRKPQKPDYYNRIIYLLRNKREVEEAQRVEVRDLVRQPNWNKADLSGVTSYMEVPEPDLGD